MMAGAGAVPWGAPGYPTSAHKEKGVGNESS